MVRQDDPALSVTELVDEIRDAVELAFPVVAVSGEVSRPVLASSGHLYLTLKDDRNTLPVVMWRSSAGRLGFDVEEGMRVTARGNVSVYGPQGRYQLIATSLAEEGGVGALAAALEALKGQLADQGLLDPDRKQALPFRPHRIALVTSPTGAVVHDLIDTIVRRCPRITILVVPVRVQGDGAAAEIAAAVDRCDREDLAEVVVVARGGGSLEDLWAFNEEAVARAIAACRLPVVSAVGHETDFTISDMVADVRAKTPTEAGFLVVPDLAEEIEMVEGRRRDLVRAISAPIERFRERLEGFRRSAALAGPRELVSRRREAVERAGAHLRAVSPRSVLARGYSITRGPDGRVVRGWNDVTEGDEIETLLGAGRLLSRVLAGQEDSDGE